MTLRIPLALGVLLCSAGAAAAQEGGTLRITLEGQTAVRGVVELPGGARLSDAMLAARPAADAYLPGASYQQHAERAGQLRLRAGLAHTLSVLERTGKPAIQAAASGMAAWLEAHPATGRISIPAAARLMQVQPRINPVLGDGDLISFPVRPDTVRVMGAVAEPCTLPHRPHQDARAYARACAPTQAADPNDLYVIQPDAMVQKLGVAAWNRADPQAVAPGGTVYVPLREAQLGDLDPDFNAEFASFVATQPVEPR